MKMTNLDFLKNDFNTALLAKAFKCSVGRINELRHEPIENEIYHYANINTKALYDFAVKHEIDLDAIDFTEICAVKQKVAKVEYKVYTETTFGTIISVQKVGNTTVYAIRDKDNNILLKSNKELHESEEVAA